jgi:hypothetical protein
MGGFVRRGAPPVSRRWKNATSVLGTAARLTRVVRQRWTRSSWTGHDPPRAPPLHNAALRPCQARVQDTPVADPVCCAPVPREGVLKARQRCTRLAWDALWCCLCRARWRWVQWAICSTCARPSPRLAWCCSTLSTRSLRACKRRSLHRPWSAPATWLLFFCAGAHQALACDFPFVICICVCVGMCPGKCMCTISSASYCGGVHDSKPLSGCCLPHSRSTAFLRVSSGLWPVKTEAVAEPVCLHRACLSATSPPSAPAGYIMTGEPPTTHLAAVHRVQQLTSSHWALPVAHAYGLQPTPSRNLQAARQLPAQLLARCAPRPAQKLRAVRAARP